MYICDYDIIILFSHKQAEGWATYYLRKTYNLYLHLQALGQKVDIIQWECYCNKGAYKIVDTMIININTSSTNKLFIFDELCYFSFYYLWLTHRTIVSQFLSRVSYHIFFSEIFENNNLSTVGCESKHIHHFAIYFFKNAKKIYLCDTMNSEYLVNNGISKEQIVYFPLYVDTFSFSNFQEMAQNDTDTRIDILFYGNILNLSYREHMLSSIREYAQQTNKTCVISNSVYDQDKKKMLLNTNIVIHIPIFKNLRSFPWAKVAELMKSKVFFIIEENEEMYIQDLDKIIVYYERHNLEDLKNKIEYYLQNTDKRIECTKRCFELFEKKYSLMTILKAPE